MTSWALKGKTHMWPSHHGNQRPWVRRPRPLNLTPPHEVSADSQQQPHLSASQPSTGPRASHWLTVAPTEGLPGRGPLEAGPAAPWLPRHLRSNTKGLSLQSTPRAALTQGLSTEPRSSLCSSRDQILYFTDLPTTLQTDRHSAGCCSQAAACGRRVTL